MTSAEHPVREEASQDVPSRVEAVWRLESARVVGALARFTGDLGQGEDLAQEAVAEALAQWPTDGVPANPGAWLTAVGKRRAIDGWRRRDRLTERERVIAHELDERQRTTDHADSWEPIDDDVLRLVFTACHPVLSREARIALTLKVVTGMTTEEIARMFVVPVPTVQQRIVRAKKTLAAARVPVEVPEEDEWEARLGAVLQVVYLVFTEGYSPTAGEAVIRSEVAAEALRLGRVLTGLVPAEPEAWGLLALMELQAARFPARVARDGTPVLLEDQDRTRWNRTQINLGLAALGRADEQGRARGPYALQAAIAACHATATSVEDTDWDEIVSLYAALESIGRNPVVTLNRAIAVSMASGPEDALVIVDEIAAGGALDGTHLLPSVRGELLARLGRTEEARSALRRAVELTANARQRAVLEAKIDDL